MPYAKQGRDPAFHEKSETNELISLRTIQFKPLEYVNSTKEMRRSMPHRKRMGLMDRLLHRKRREE